MEDCLTMWANRIRNYFGLGFVLTPASPELPLMLGKKRPSRRREVLWATAAWFLLACGIFLRKALVILDVSWNASRLTPGTFLASGVIAFAVFPPFMLWFRKRRPKVGLEHFATPFAFGFFLDLARVAAFHYWPH
jgi:hypothetical protein